MDGAVRAMLDDAYARARSILQSNREVLDEGAMALLAKEALDEAEPEALRARLRRPGDPAPAAAERAV